MPKTAPKPAAKKKRVPRRSATGRKPRTPTMAARADRHVLYQNSVQDVEAEIDFVDETFESIRGRKATVLREDFCGTANTSCEWVRRRKTNRAFAVDLDPSVLEWGRTHNVAKLPPDAQQRLRVINGDVLTASTGPVEIVLAMNFSYWLFKKRAELLRYFRAVHSTLAPDGVFFMDGYGGWDAHRTIRESRDCDGFVYIWDQDEFDPISSEMVCHIHFKFPDGSRLNKAFSYHWRLWSIAEIRELLAEAGFARSRVYWEGADDDTGDGNGEFEQVERTESDPGWICYIAAEK